MACHAAGLLSACTAPQPRCMYAPTHARSHACCLTQAKGSLGSHLDHIKLLYILRLTAASFFLFLSVSFCFLVNQGLS